MKITDTIRDVDETEWENLAGTNQVERSHGWFRTVEDAHMRNMQYLFLKDNTLRAAACCHIYTEKMGIKMPFLEVASPLGTSTGFFSKTPAHTSILLKELLKIQNREKTKGILFLNLTKEELDFIRPQAKGFTTFQLIDNTYLDLGFTDFEDYLSSLNGKKRRSIRITLNKAKKLNVRTVFTNEISTWKKIAHQLQGYICEQYQNYRFHLPEEFYDALEKNLNDNAELVFFFKDNIPLAFALAINTPATSLYKFVGVDPRYREYQAYFLIYYEGIKKAIERRQKRIYFGPTSYEFKDKIGCKRKELFGLVKLKNPFLHLALTSFITGYTLLGKKF